MEELLRFENVSFAYEEGREEYPALRGCSVTVSAGERIAVLGENGAGKSTFFLLANGVLRPWEGTVYFLGHPVGRRELNDLRRGVGLVFQGPGRTDPGRNGGGGDQLRPHEPSPAPAGGGPPGGGGPGAASDHPSARPGASIPLRRGEKADLHCRRTGHGAAAAAAG